MVNCKGFGRKRPWPDRDTIQVSEVTEENYEKSQDRRCLDLNSNPVLPEYKLLELPLHRPVRPITFYLACSLHFRGKTIEDRDILAGLSCAIAMKIS
jgi:hypothetical protein